MTSVRPVAAGPSEGASSTRPGRGSGDLFAGLLEVAGGDPNPAVRDPSERPSPHPRAYRSTGCVVRPRRMEDTPVHRPEEPPATDPATDPSDEAPERSADSPATAAPTPPVFDVEAALNAGRAAAWIAQPADGWASAPTAGTPTAGTPDSQPNLSPGTPLGTLPGPLASLGPASLAAAPTSEPGVAGRSGTPATALLAGAVTGPVDAPATAPAGTVGSNGPQVPGGRADGEPVGRSDRLTGTDLANPGVTDRTTEVVTSAEAPAAAVGDPTDAAEGAPDAAPPAPESPGAASTPDHGGQAGAGHRDGRQDRRDDRTPATEAVGGVVPPHESLAAGTPDAGGSAQPGGAAAPGAAPSPSSSTGGPGPLQAAGAATGPLGGPAYAGSPAPGSAGSTASVTGQVIPEVARLVTRGDGTQRVTVKLAPEALGEVRIVLTVRRGEVHVRLTGSEAAQQALLSGQSDLHRLLAGAGATSSSVQVGDQAATLGSPASGSPDGSVGNATDHGAGSRDDRPHHGPDGAHGRAGADVRRDASGRQPGGPAASTNPSRRQSGRLDVSV